MLPQKMVNVLLCSLHLILEIMAVLNKDNVEVNNCCTKVNQQLSIKPYRNFILRMKCVYMMTTEVSEE